MIKTEHLPLHRKISEPKPFPSDALGPILGDVVKRLTEIVQSADGVNGNSVLAAVSLATQAHRNIGIDGRQSPLSEYFLTIAETGGRKSAADSIVLRPHYEHEKALATKYKSDISVFEKDMAVVNKLREKILAKGKDRACMNKALADIDEPICPLEPGFLPEEPSLEGLFKSFQDGQPSQGIFSDEGGSMVGGYGMSQENLLKTISGLSKFWDGRRISRVRAGDGASLLYGKRLSLHLMMQPVVSLRIVANELIDKQGFLARCLTVWPKSTYDTRRYKTVDLSDDPILVLYWERVKSILERPMAIREGTRNELEFKSLTITDLAKQMWIQFHDETVPKSADGRDFESIRGLANKAPEHALRLAGILTVFDDPDASEVGSLRMANGIELTKYYLAESLRIVDASSVNGDILLAEKVFEWAKKFEFVYLSKIYRCGPSGVRDRAGAMRICKILQKHDLFVRCQSRELDGAMRKDVWKVCH